MALYDMTALQSGRDSMDGAEGDAGRVLSTVRRTSFAQEGIHERGHLQAALRDRIEVIDDGLFVIAEEFGDFEGVNRRIDLLCLDKDCRLVVVELKRTSDGGHMELQALRYAAMVSTMTFSQVVRVLARYRKSRGFSDDTDETARADVLGWLDHDDEVDGEPVVSRDVGVVLASEDFSQEITTTVLWLNEFHGFDIRCVRLRPYRLEDRLLLDVQQVIPLPESSLYTVRVREKEIATRRVPSGETKADWTKFVISTPEETTAPLAKRWAVLRLVEGVARAGVDMERVTEVLPNSKLLKVSGVYPDADALWAAVKTQLDRPESNRPRWHLEHPIVKGEDTWVLNNNWGLQTRRVFQELLDIAPSGFAVREHVAPDAQGAS